MELVADAPRAVDETYPALRTSGRAKRFVDVFGAVLSLLVLWPVGLLIAIVIRSTSRGPAVFRQERVGHDGETFTMLKFRTMQHGTHGEVLDCVHQHHHYATNDFKLPADDPRITRVGRILRASSFDEFPQLYNVLRGEMSLVGVRPIEQAQLERRPAHVQAAYVAMKPGMTGLWQTSGRSSLSTEERDALDVEYVRSWSLWLDIKMLLKTPLAMVRFAHTA